MVASDPFHNRLFRYLHLSNNKLAEQQINVIVERPGLPFVLCYMSSCPARFYAVHLCGRTS